LQDDPSKAASYAPSVLEKITFSTDLNAIKNSELVLEAIVENLEVKQKLFKDIEAVSFIYFLNFKVYYYFPTHFETIMRK